MHKPKKQVTKKTARSRKISSLKKKVGGTKYTLAELKDTLNKDKIVANFIKDLQNPDSNPVEEILSNPPENILQSIGNRIGNATKQEELINRFEYIINNLFFHLVENDLFYTKISPCHVAILYGREDFLKFFIKTILEFYKNVKDLTGETNVNQKEQVSKIIVNFCNQLAATPDTGASTPDTASAALATPSAALATPSAALATPSAALATPSAAFDFLFTQGYYINSERKIVNVLKNFTLANIKPQKMETILGQLKLLNETIINGKVLESNIQITPIGKVTPEKVKEIKAIIEAANSRVYVSGDSQDPYGKDELLPKVSYINGEISFSQVFTDDQITEINAIEQKYGKYEKFVNDILSQLGVQGQEGQEVQEEEEEEEEEKDQIVDIYIRGNDLLVSINDIQKRGEEKGEEEGEEEQRQGNLTLSPEQKNQLQQIFGEIEKDQKILMTMIKDNSYLNAKIQKNIQHSVSREENTNPFREMHEKIQQNIKESSQQEGNSSQTPIIDLSKTPIFILEYSENNEIKQVKVDYSNIINDPMSS